jgi:hypothetical protein
MDFCLQPNAGFARFRGTFNAANALRQADLSRMAAQLPHRMTKDSE